MPVAAAYGTWCGRYGPGGRISDDLITSTTTLIFFLPTSTTPQHTKQGMTATASNWSLRCQGRRPHFPFGGLLTTAEIDMWILSVHQ